MPEFCRTKACDIENSDHWLNTIYCFFSACHLLDIIRTKSQKLWRKHSTIKNFAGKKLVGGKYEPHFRQTSKKCHRFKFLAHHFLSAMMANKKTNQRCQFKQKKLPRDTLIKENREINSVKPSLTASLDNYSLSFFWTWFKMVILLMK